MVYFLDTATRSKREFIPIQEGKVEIYSCGPTVYDRAHIGNLSAFIFVDILKRWLRFQGYEVFHVMNITDVDDKTIRGAESAGTTLTAFTEKYTEVFMEELALLNILPADVYPRATEYIDEMVKLVQILLNKGYAYIQDGSVYFSIDKFPGYGDFAGIDKGVSQKKARINADEYTKDDARDFVLWKAWKPEEDGFVYWDTAIGRGRPGWHIECSAMSMRCLGPTFDIHTGGIDLVFPHHQNEIAQSEAASGQKFVNYWLHREHLMVNGSKMSKSAGTGLVLRDIAKNPLEIDAFRYLIASSYYRSPLNFTAETFEAAKKALLHLRSVYVRLGQSFGSGEDVMMDDIRKARDEFVNAMDNDLNTPQAMAAIFKIVAQAERLIAENKMTLGSAEASRRFLREVDDILGVITKGVFECSGKITGEQWRLIGERSIARKQKDWIRADEIRENLKRQGVLLEDTEQGTKARAI